MCLHHVHHIPYRSHSSLALRPKHIFLGTILGVRPLKLEMEWLHVVTPCIHAPQEPMGMKEACHGLSKKLWGSSGLFCLVMVHNYMSGLCWQHVSGLVNVMGPWSWSDRLQAMCTLWVACAVVSHGSLEWAWPWARWWPVGGLLVCKVKLGHLRVWHAAYVGNEIGLWHAWQSMTGLHMGGNVLWGQIWEVA